MKKFFSVIVLGALLLSLAGCTENAPKQNDQQIVKIGVILPLSGPAANYGQDAVATYQYVVDKFNSTNKNIRVELIIEDGLCNGRNATSAVQKLIMIDKVESIVGGFCSAETIAAGKIAQENKVFMLSPGSSAPEILNIGDYVYRYRNDADATKRLGRYMNDQGLKNLLIIAENADYSIGYAASLKKYFSGNTIQENYSNTEKDFSVITKKIRKQVDDNAIDSVIVITSSDSNTISLIESLRDQGILQSLKGHVFGTEITAGDSVKARLGSSLDNIKLVQFLGLNELGVKSKDFIEEVEKSFTINSSPLFVVLEAEAMQIVLDAIKINGNDADAIRAYVTKYSPSNLRHGIIGDYYFTDGRVASSLTFNVYQFLSGDLKIIQ